MRLRYLLVILLYGETLLAQPSDTAKLAAYIQAQVAVNGFNGTILVAQKGQIRYQKAVGYANYETKTLLDLNLVFEWRFQRHRATVRRAVDSVAL